MRFLILASVALLISTPAIAGEWHEVGNSDNYFVGLDTSQIIRSGDLSTVWVVQAAADSYRVSRAEMNCRLKTMTTLTATVYNESGSILYSDRNRSGPEQIYPDSVLETLFNVSCNFTNRRFFGSGRNKASDFFRYYSEILKIP